MTRIVLGLNNGTLYFSPYEGVWFSQYGNECNWIEYSLAKRPEDWQIIPVDRSNVRGEY